MGLGFRVGTQDCNKALRSVTSVGVTGAPQAVVSGNAKRFGMYQNLRQASMQHSLNPKPLKPICRTGRLPFGRSNSALDQSSRIFCLMFRNGTKQQKTETAPCCNLIPHLNQAPPSLARKQSLACVALQAETCCHVAQAFCGAV